MRQRVFHRSHAHLFKRSVAKRSARSSEDQAFDRFIPLPLQTLIDCARFRVDRNKLRLMLVRHVHNELASRHNRFFICKSYRLPMRECEKCRLDTCHTDDRVYHNVPAVSRTYVNLRMLPCKNRNLSTKAQCCCRIFVCNCDTQWLELIHLFLKKFNVATRGKRHDAKFFWKSTHNLECLLSD